MRVLFLIDFELISVKFEIVCWCCRINFGLDCNEMEIKLFLLIYECSGVEYVEVDFIEIMVLIFFWLVFLFLNFKILEFFNVFRVDIGSFVWYDVCRFNRKFWLYEVFEVEKRVWLVCKFGNIIWLVLKLKIKCWIGIGLGFIEILMNIVKLSGGLCLGIVRDVKFCLEGLLSVFVVLLKLVEEISLSLVVWSWDENIMMWFKIFLK